MQIDFDYFGIYFQNVLHKMYLEICTVTFRLLPIVIAVGYKNHLKYTSIISSSMWSHFM